MASLNNIDTRCVDLKNANDYCFASMTDYFRRSEHDWPELANGIDSRYTQNTTNALQSTMSGEYSLPIEPSSSSIQKIALHSHGMKPKIQGLVVAACIEIAQLVHRQDTTVPITATPIIKMLQQYKASVFATVSRALQVPREKALETSLLAPSGAYLSWLALDCEDGTE